MPGNKAAAHRVDGPVAQQQHAVKNALDDVGRALERLEARDVRGADAVERRQRVVQRRLGHRQVALGVVLRGCVCHY